MSALSRFVEAVRGTAKDIAERTLVSTRIGRAYRRRNRDSVLILAYHNVLPEGAVPTGDRSLHLSRSAFSMQLDLLQNTHRIVSIGDLADGGRDNQKDRRPKAVLTFDDAYRGAMTAGLDEVCRRNLPATVFVAPGRLGSPGFWWDQVAAALGGMRNGVRSKLLTRFKGRQEVITTWLEDEKGKPPPQLPEYARPVTEEELAEAVGKTGLTVGSHTWSHPHLPTLNAESNSVMWSELVRARNWLSNRFPGSFRPWLAYPYGATNAEVTDAAAAAGYRSAVLIRGGFCKLSNVDGRAHELPRLNVPAGVSIRGFQLRTSGLYVS